MSVNKVILLGNVGRNPETKQLQNGTNVTTISLATSRRVKVGDAYQDETEWHRVIFFGKTADTIQAHVTKGACLYIEGRIKTNKYTGQDGIERYSTSIIADLFKFAGNRTANEGGSQPTQAPAAAAPSPVAPKPVENTSAYSTAGGGFISADVPF